MIFGIEVTDRSAVRHRFAFFKRHDVNDRSTATLTRQLRQLVNFSPMYDPAIGEEQQIVVRAGGKNVLNRVLVFALGPFDSFTTATLSPISADGSSLDVSAMADRCLLYTSPSPRD